VGRKAGITEAQLRDLASFEQSPAFDATQRLILRLATAMTRAPASVNDQLFASLRQVFTEPQLVELSAAIAWENYRARFNRTFAIASEGFSEGAFCPLPETSETHSGA
jgi:alkylhydroperoxidase family enzyme